MTDGIRDSLGMDSIQKIKKGETTVEASELRALRQRAEWAERERDELQNRFDTFIRDCGTTMYSCSTCGHGMSSRVGCLHCERDKLWKTLEDLCKRVEKHRYILITSSRSEQCSMLDTSGARYVLEEE